MVSRFAWLAACALAVTGCTKTVELHEPNPVLVNAKPPPLPKPEPPPPKRVEVKKEKIQVNEKIHFEFDSAKIKEDSHDLLDEISQVINDHPEILKLRVDGHTDNVGSSKYNLDLSKRRAKAVRDYLVNQGKVDASRLETAGHGFEEPIATNDTDEGRAKNRRVEFNILKRDMSLAPPAKEGEGAEGVETENASAEGTGEGAAKDGADKEDAEDENTGGDGTAEKFSADDGADSEGAGDDEDEPSKAGGDQ